MPTLSLTGSVGRNGTNDRDDVLLVQQLLNGYLSGLLPPTSIDEDGIVGPQTIGAIEQFQEDVVKLSNVDGRVDPDGRTFHALLVIASEPAPAPTIAWGSRVSDQFKRKVIAICGRLNADPNHLMAAIAFESGQTFSPDVTNKTSGATGLIQFMPSTAARLGTSVSALSRMSAEDQLDFVEKYLAPYTGRLVTVEDMYMAILWPVAIGKALDFVLFKTPSQSYIQNRFLDANRDGVVTKAEAAAPVVALLDKGLALAG
jgi:hypothetical protein